MIRAEAEPLPEGTPGYGRIVVTGVAPPPGELKFTLQREGFATANLGRRGWQASEERLVAERVDQVPESGGWAIVIGPALSRHLRPAPYLLGLPALGQDLPIFWPDAIEMPVEDQDLSPPPPKPETRWPEPPPRRPEPPPEKPPETVQPQPPPEKADPPPPVPLWKKPLPLALAGIVLALAVAAVLFRDTLFPPAQERVEEARTAPPAPPQPPPQPAPAPTPQPARTPAAPGWPDSSDNLPLPDVVTRAPDNPGIVAAARRRQAAGRHDDALALFEEAAARGQPSAFFELARMYDPVGFVAGRPFRSPDAFQAARNYAEAIRLGHTAAEGPRAALRAHLEGLANGGDVNARATLREFWR